MARRGGDREADGRRAQVVREAMHENDPRLLSPMFAYIHPVLISMHENLLVGTHSDPPDSRSYGRSPLWTKSHIYQARPGKRHRKQSVDAPMTLEE
jgi:hypothetical protein